MKIFLLQNQENPQMEARSFHALKTWKTRFVNFRQIIVEANERKLYLFFVTIYRFDSVYPHVYNSKFIFTLH